MIFIYIAIWTTTGMLMYAATVYLQEERNVNILEYGIAAVFAPLVLLALIRTIREKMRLKKQLQAEGAQEAVERLSHF